MKSKRYRIINKTRFYTFLTIMLIIGGLTTSMLFSTAKAYSNPVDLPYEEVIVAEGDTLWYIAIEFMPRNYDVRQMVYDIRQLNKMDTGSIHPGDLIKVPIVK
jgi:hypothetical protein